MSSEKMFASVGRYASWAEDYQKYLKSGLTQEEWCRKNGMSINTFRYRLSRLRKYFDNDISDLIHEINDVSDIEIAEGVDDIVLESGGKKIYLSSSMEPDKLKLVIEMFMKYKN